MLKRILVALDGTPGAVEARGLAMRLAEKHGAALSAVAVIDPAIVAPPEPTPLGGESYKLHKDAVLIEKARAAAQELVQRFADEARAAQIAADARVAHGDASDVLNAAAAGCDVVALGVDTSLGGEDCMLSPLIAELLRNNPRPLIVAPRQAATGGRTFVAYDGSIPAMRALQIFCYMQLRLDGEIVVASSDGDAAKAEALAATGAQFLRDHGYNAVGQPLAQDGDVTAALIEAARAADAGMIVAGAYGHRGWRDWLLGATTERLLTSSPVPLFIHH